MEVGITRLRCLYLLQEVFFFLSYREFRSFRKHFETSTGEQRSLHFSPTKNNEARRNQSRDQTSTEDEAATKRPAPGAKPIRTFPSVGLLLYRFVSLLFFFNFARDPLRVRFRSNDDQNVTPSPLFLFPRPPPFLSSDPKIPTDLLAAAQMESRPRNRQTVRTDSEKLPDDWTSRPKG